MATDKRPDLIDRLNLLGSLGYDPMKFWAITPESTFGIVLNAPTVDAVEVVRCKDCVYYREEELLCVGVSCVGDSHANWYPDDYCSYGERKDNG